MVFLNPHPPLSEFNALQGFLIMFLVDASTTLSILRGEGGRVGGEGTGSGAGGHTDKRAVQGAA